MNGSVNSFAARLKQALGDLRAGKPVLVADNLNREGEVDVVLAASQATPEWIGWMVRHTSGFVCAPMPDAWADRLELPPMVANSQDRLRTAYTVSVDAASGVTTGISAADRARTLQVLADPNSVSTDLIRPGHILPLRAHPQGIAVRPGHTEAAVDLVQRAGVGQVAVIAELVHDSGRMLTFAESQALAQDNSLVYLSIDELLAAP